MSSLIPSLLTSRLVLRPLTLEDASVIQRIFSQWEVVQFMANRIPWPFPDDGAFKFICDTALPAMEEGKEWYWSIRLNEDPEQIVGLITLKEQEDNNRGFWLDPDWHGQGIATEASRVVTDYWFEVLERPIMRVCKAMANIGSQRISEQGGMRRIRIEERHYVSGRLPGSVWEMTRDEWRAFRTDNPVIYSEIFEI
jgi:[ribosomal protein S5]-alanine N-acetyltransferase